MVFGRSPFQNTHPNKEPRTGPRSPKCLEAMPSFIPRNGAKNRTPIVLGGENGAHHGLSWFSFPFPILDHHPGFADQVIFDSPELGE